MVVAASCHSPQHCSASQLAPLLVVMVIHHVGPAHLLRVELYMVSLFGVHYVLLTFTR